jgi:hypothetical protein
MPTTSQAVNERIDCGTRCVGGLRRKESIDLPDAFVVIHHILPQVVVVVGARVVGELATTSFTWLAAGPECPQPAALAI